MSFAANNVTVWKQIADEKEDAARLMGKIAAGLFAVCMVLAAIAFSTHLDYAGICSFVEKRHLAQAGGFGEEEITAILKADYCS